MSERERWIVYPLLFFALGASIRDKLLQRVEAKNIRCESLQIVDLNNPQRILAEFGLGKTIDTATKSRAAVLRADELICKSVIVTDRRDPTKLLVVLGTELALNQDGSARQRRVGTLFLTDTEGNQSSVMRADQLISNRIISNQLLIVDPVKSYPRFIATTQSMAGSVADGSTSTLEYQAVLYLNNRILDNRPPPQQAPHKGF